MHVYRWDLDRTYLDTAIDSVRGLIRSALEDASTKRALPGATALLRGLVDAHPDSHVCILSGSPLQMRPVLEEKLALDGIRFDKLILKDNLGNLRRGRLRALRGQVGYKLPALLVERQHASPHARETLFGDDSEADALIYVAFAEVLAGRLPAEDLRKLLVRSGAYSDHVDTALLAARSLPQGDVVDDVFIRLDKRSAPDRFAQLGPLVVPVHHWLQAALVLWSRQRLTPRHVAEVARDVEEAAGAGAVAGLVQDAVRRGLVDTESMERLLEAPALERVREPVQRALAWLPEAPPALHRAGPPDLFGFLERLQEE
jgi:hypothetical protein